MRLAGLVLSAGGMIVLLLLLVSSLAGNAAGPEQREAVAADHDAEPDGPPSRLLERARAGEPRVEAVQRAAEARAAPSRAETSGWARRARLAALMPRVSSSVRHDVRSYHVFGYTSGEEVDYVRSTPGDAVALSLDFDLSGLVFNGRELEAAAAAERAEAARRAAAERATKLYFERLRLRVALVAGPPADASARLQLAMALEAVTAELHALTGLFGEVRP